MNGVRVVPLPNSAEEAQALRAPAAGDAPATHSAGAADAATGASSRQASQATRLFTSVLPRDPRRASAEAV